MFGASLFHRCSRTSTIISLSPTAYPRSTLPTAVVNPNLRSPSNVFEVQGSQPELWDVQDVPHGIVHQHFYKSAIIGDQRDYFVYTPPSYDPRGHKKYPVLYLLHGYTDDARAWTALGRANVILDNLIAAGQRQADDRRDAAGLWRTGNRDGAPRLVQPRRLAQEEPRSVHRRRCSRK